MSRVLPYNAKQWEVRAIMDRRKTVTRRLVKPRWKEGEAGFNVVKRVNEPDTYGNWYVEKYDEDEFDFSPRRFIEPPYQPGDILYVRETWHKYEKRVGKGENCHIAEFYGYKASIANSEDASEKWRPSIHMPKEAARIWLKVTDVRVERLQDITEEQASAEGIGEFNIGMGERGFALSYDSKAFYDTAVGAFVDFWYSTIKKSDLDRYGWDANPWVWVIEFERCEKPENV